MGWLRQKRLIDQELPAALDVSFQRAAKLSLPEKLVWAESTSLGVNRLLDEFRNTQDPNKIADAYEHALTLAGLLRSMQA